MSMPSSSHRDCWITFKHHTSVGRCASLQDDWNAVYRQPGSTLNQGIGPADFAVAFIALQGNRSAVDGKGSIPLGNAATNVGCVTREHRAHVVMTFQRSEEHTSELQSRPHLVCR